MKTKPWDPYPGRKVYLTPMNTALDLFCFKDAVDSVTYTEPSPLTRLGNQNHNFLQESTKELGQIL